MGTFNALDIQVYVVGQRMLLALAPDCGDSEDYLSNAVKALEKADKHKWHNLKKDPRDLAGEGAFYYFYPGYYTDLMQSITGDHPVAWRYIDPGEPDGTDYESILKAASKLIKETYENTKYINRS